ncbi:MAG: hypothetical protein IT299_08390 [Dehalococcoidia bacterium]|nr:hypothetical protein [Dehalococcoidia bacterium]
MPLRLPGVDISQPTVRTVAARNGAASVLLPVEHRVLRVGPVRVGRRSVRRVDARVDGRLTTLDVPRVADPWVTAALATLVVWVCCAVLVTALRWRTEHTQVRGAP